MTDFQYKRAPITEAVIEIRLEDSLPEKVVEKIHNRLKKNYVLSERITSVGIMIDPRKKEIEKTPDEFEVYKLSSVDHADIVQIKPNAMVCSRLAPYDGWANFELRARGNWEVWRKITKHIKIKRIGVRYINRIDIPFRKGDKLDVEDYLTVVPKYPEPHLLTSFTNYTMQIVGPFSVEGFYFIINTNVVKSPLIDHFSIVLDLDLLTQGDIPQRNDKVWKMINRMREFKNNAFEMCITDKARELFV